MPAIQRTDPIGYTAEIIARLGAARRKIASECAIITEATERMSAAQEDANKAFRELHEELKRMDLSSSGNYGWEARIANFLVAVKETP